MRLEQLWDDWPICQRIAVAHEIVNDTDTLLGLMYAHDVASLQLTMMVDPAPYERADRFARIAVDLLRKRRGLRVRHDRLSLKKEKLVEEKSRRVAECEARWRASDRRIVLWSYVFAFVATLSLIYDLVAGASAIRCPYSISISLVQFCVKLALPIAFVATGTPVLLFWGWRCLCTSKICSMVAARLEAVTRPALHGFFDALGWAWVWLIILIDCHIVSIVIFLAMTSQVIFWSLVHMLATSLWVAIIVLIVMVPRIHCKRAMIKEVTCVKTELGGEIARIDEQIEITELKLRQLQLKPPPPRSFTEWHRLQHRRNVARLLKGCSIL